ncbi:uncharacterized protein IUM83_17012 [Phytophthora cinnamomi]|uniref:uncharacterized protein n=1 Tax=Phytophthora cinnamomi TaxID=4785 RepID=UPI00355AB3E4|nr:hypothetical protein IUM83_17012 [Phytophthora cinnamomi]
MAPSCRIDEITSAIATTQITSSLLIPLDLPEIQDVMMNNDETLCRQTEFFRGQLNGLVLSFVCIMYYTVKTT